LQRSSSTTTEVFSIDFLKHNPSIELEKIEIINGTIAGNKIYTTLRFDPVGGGSSSFLGIEISETDPSKYKRLKIKCNEEEHNFSTIDISKWEHKTNNNKVVLIAPKICNN